MAQQQLIIPNRDFSGSDLAELLDNYGEAQASGHLGKNRPSYITKGGKWTRENDDGSLSIMLCLGENDTVLDTITSNGMSSGLPKGFIGMWSGAASAIPKGWALCDGKSGRPDLRNRFVIGAGSSYKVGATGGGVTKTSSSNGAHAHSFSKTTSSGGNHRHIVKFWSNNHTLSVGQMPKHEHAAGYKSNLGRGWADTGPGAEFSKLSSVSQNGYQNTGYSGSSQAHRHLLDGASHDAGAHTHTVSGNTNNTGAHTHTVNVLPPYYALAFIIKL